jgi:DNA-binding LytR/AlgR family response regulator
LVLSLNNIVLPSIFPRLFLKGNWKLYMDILLQLLSWAMLAVAYNFYTRYVGQVALTFATSFRIILVGLFPVVILVLVNRFKNLRLKVLELEELAQEAGISPTVNSMDPEVTFDSENKSEILTLKLSEILFIHSANNYIEVYWLSGDTTNKQLLRSTLKRAEEILRMHNKMLRCHRSILVNADHIIRFTGTPGNLRLKLHHTDEEIPVSRQYLQTIKEALKGRRGR